MSALRGVLLLSGGLDSAAAGAAWLARGNEIALALTLDYGQLAAQRERDAALALATRWGVTWRSVLLPWLGEAAAAAGSALMGSAELPSGGTVSAPGDAASAAAVWVPARNLVFLAIASAWAETVGAEAVIVGFNREEAATFPDNSAAFVSGFNQALRHAARQPVRVEAPTLEMDKREIVALARRAEIGPSDVWSCYTGQLEPCGRCESCVRSARAWGAG